MGTLDDQIRADAAAAQKMVRRYFVVELDYSEMSVRDLEALFDDIAFSLPGGRSEENTQRIQSTWGSYLGEVIRRNCGGVWVGQAGSAAALRGKSAIIYPHQQVEKRLRGDASESIWDYYQAHRDLM